MSSNGYHSNGHSTPNGKSRGKGDKGEGVPKKDARPSGPLRFLRGMLNRGDYTLETLEQAEVFCRSILESTDGQISPRDRNNAARTVASIVKIKADVALSLNKDERIDNGEDTERIAVRYADEHSVRMSEDILR